MNSRKQSQNNSSSNNPSQPKRRANIRNPNRNRNRNPRSNRSNRPLRRNRRFSPFVTRRNRLARAQYASNTLNQRRRRRRFIFRRRARINLRLRKIFVGGLHKSINNAKLYNLFRREGRILGWRVFYDRNGYSRGFGVLEFDRPRDAWKTIQKWNGTSYMGYKLRIEYKKNIRRRMNRRRRFNGYNYGNVINKGFNNFYFYSQFYLH